MQSDTIRGKCAIDATVTDRRYRRRRRDRASLQDKEACKRGSVIYNPSEMTFVGKLVSVPWIG